MRIRGGADLPHDTRGFGLFCCATKRKGRKGLDSALFITAKGRFGKVIAILSPSSPSGGFGEVYFVRAEKEEGAGEPGPHASGARNKSLREQNEVGPTWRWQQRRDEIHAKLTDPQLRVPRSTVRENDLATQAHLSAA